VSDPVSTHLQLDAHRTTLSTPDGGEAVLMVGVDDLAVAIFKHDPPTPTELERAIDVVEDALMLSRITSGNRGNLVTRSAALRGLPGLQDEGEFLTRAEVEALFQRMASASLGNPGAMKDLPGTRPSCAALLILRECMHHLDYQVARAAGGSASLAQPSS